MGESCIDLHLSSGSSTPPEQNTETFLLGGGGGVQLVQVAHSVGVTLTTSLPLFVCLCVCERDAITPKTLPFQGSPWKRRLQRCARPLRCPFNF